MKSKFLVVLVAILTLVSCSEKDLYTEVDTEKGVADLIVPAGFGWSTVSAVNCRFTASSNTYVYVYTASDCEDSSLVAEFTVVPGDDEGLDLDIPCSVKQLYVKVGDVVTLVDIKNNVAELNIPSATRANNGNLPGEDLGGIRYFPAKAGMATVMFEDYFPVKGDFDFNDYVINYRYEASIEGSNDDNKKVKDIKFDIKIRARGGLYAYTPYLRLIAANGQFSSKEEIESDGATVVDTNPVVLSIDKYSAKPVGAQYLNTKPNEVKVPAADLETTTFHLFFHSNGMSQKHLKVDFFLRGTGHQEQSYEIHERGFEATSASFYPKGDFGLDSTVPYATTDNLVWGFTVPADIPHATETTNFLNAYPKFAQWVQSNGTSAQDWYNMANRKPEYLFEMD